MTPFQIPNIKGHFGHDAQRASRVYHFANSQPTWAARMAAFILGTLILLLVLLVLLPLIVLGMLLVGLLVLARRARVAFLGIGSGRRAGPIGSGGGAASAGRKNVRVREPRDH